MSKTELTHFERALRPTVPYDQDGRVFAQRAVASNKPGELFSDFIAKGRRSLPSVVKSEAELVRALLPINARALCYVHHITQEFLRKQQNKWSFTELTKNMVYGKLMSVASVAGDAQTVNSNGHMHFHMAAHRLAGKKVYSVSPGLAEMLRNTELRGLTGDDLKLPLPSVYIQVPEESELQIFNTYSDWHKVIGIYITEDVDAENFRCWRFLVCGEPKPIQVAEGLHDDNDALIYFHVPLPEKMSLTDSVARAQEETKKDVEELEKLHHTGFTPMLERWQEIFRWAMNVVLYVSMEGAEQEEVIANEEARRLVEQMESMPKGSKGRHKIGGRLSGMQQCRRIILGRSVVRKEWTLTVRVLVTGHWRNQPFGPGSMYRRLQWIEPFWRGPDVATPTAEMAPASQGEGGDVQDGPRNREINTGGRGHDAKTQQGDRGADGSAAEPSVQPLKEGVPEAQPQ